RKHHAENFERMFAPARKALARNKVPVEFVEVVDAVATGILDTANKQKVDLVVMGSRGSGGIKVTLLGSVSMKVPAGSQVPVTIVHRRSARRIRHARSGERGFDVAAQAFGRVRRRIAPQHLAVAADQELGEVPLNRADAEQAALLALEPAPQRMGLRTVDLDLGEHREIDAVVERAERADRRLVARLLVAELVAGKAQHHQPALAI